MTETPSAVLLDAGGVLVLPDQDHVLAAFARAECHVERAALTEAHYRAALRFATDVDVEAAWNETWLAYLQTYIVECGVQPDDVDEVHLHLDSEFADAALWTQPVENVANDLRTLAEAGVRLGIVSNADGMMGQRLAQLEICQVGPGIAVEVECVVDSGNVGVMKPDPRIFAAAVELLDADPSTVWYVGDLPAVDVVGARRAGLRPLLMDPFGLHAGADYDRVQSLAAVAATIRHGVGR